MLSVILQNESLWRKIGFLNTLAQAPKQNIDFDGFHAPLQRRNLNDRLRSISISPLAVVVSLTIIALVGFVSWLVVDGDPQGGEPVATLKLAPPTDADKVQTATGKPSPEKIRVLDGTEKIAPETTQNEIAAEQYSAPQPLVRIGSPTDDDLKTGSTSKWIRIPTLSESGLSPIDRQFGDEEDDELFTGTISPQTPPQE